MIDEKSFSEALFVKMKPICPAVERMELYEFRYCLDNLTPESGWSTIELTSMVDISRNLEQRGWYEGIKISPKVDGKPVLDSTIKALTQQLFVGLVSGAYPTDWVLQHFYFDLRGFYFLPKTKYFTSRVIQHLGGTPTRTFEPKQAAFAWEQAVGYQEFKLANFEVDTSFIAAIDRLVKMYGTPMLIGIAGPTAAGKTEIAARLREHLQSAGKQVTTLEMDHFLLDRDFREENGIDSLGKEALHYALFLQCLADLIVGQNVQTPCYDFITGTSSHDLLGNLKPGASCVAVEAADIIFMEGNFPFLLPEVAERVAVKVVYLTDDDVRLKRKWRRDIDFRKKYELNYFRNRYFREQFLMAESAFIPQLEQCDLVVDTTHARLWATPEVMKMLE